jgi:hypothetical protein
MTYSEMSSGVKITITHVIAKAIAMALHKNRRDIGRIKFGYVRYPPNLICLIVLKSRAARNHRLS